MTIEDSPSNSDTAQRASEFVLSPFALPAIAALALALRAVMAVRTSVMFEDGPHFLEIATRFSDGDFAGALAHPYHPLYSALIALSNSLIGDIEVAALTVSVVGGTISVIASFYFLRDAFDAKVAVFGSFLFAISPYAVRFTADVQSEGVYLAFFMVGFALLYRGVSTRSSALLFAAGMSAGFAYLARPEGAGLVAVGVAVIVRDLLRGRVPIANAMKSISALGVGALGVAAPYLWVLAAGEPTGVLSGKKSLLRTFGLAGDIAGAWWMVGATVLLVGLSAYAIYRGRGAGRARSTPLAGVVVALLVVGLLAWLGGLKEFVSVSLSTLRPEVVVLLAFGLFETSRAEAKPRDAFIALALVLYVAVLIGLLANYGYLSRRHMLPLVPLVLGYAGLGAVFLVEHTLNRVPSWTADRRRGALLASLAAALLAIAAPKALHDHREDVVAQRLAAEWLGEQSLAAGRVASNKRRTGYYANRPWRALTRGSGLRGFDELAREHVRYIVVDDRVLGFRDEMLPSPGFELRELHRIREGGRSAIVYELSRADAGASANIAIGAGPPDDETR